MKRTTPKLDNEPKNPGTYLATTPSQERNNATGKTELQDIANQYSSKHPVRQLQNKTGLPDKLKTGIEGLSGESLDKVKVHRNSNKPSQLQALAFASGSDIHVAPSQEKHIPHEAWHVVQQKQGRVKPTMELKGVGINNDPFLEKEADIMGSKALRFQTMESPIIDNAAHTRNSKVIVQPKVETFNQQSPEKEKVRDVGPAELYSFLTDEGGSLTEGQKEWRDEVFDKIGGEEEVNKILARVAASKNIEFDFAEGQPNSAAVAILSFLEKQPASLKPKMSKFSELMIDNGEDDIEMLGSKLARMSDADSTKHQEKAVVSSSTINYSKSMLEAAGTLGISGSELESRKPHTKTGTGSSGTDHEAADAEAALRAKKKVEAKIEKKMGVKMSAKEFLKQSAKKEEAAGKREDKRRAGMQKRLALLKRQSEDFKDWIAYLAPESWRKKQEQLGNMVRMAPSKSKVKKLRKLVEPNGWPEVWDDMYAEDIWE